MAEVKVKVAQTQDQTPTCGACGEQLEAGAAFCDQCGAPQAGAPRCPHHRGSGNASAHAQLRYVCDICGAPVVRLNKTGFKLSGDEVQHLKDARVARRQARTWQIGGVVSAAAAAAFLGAMGLLWLLLGAGLLSGAISIALAAPLLLLAVVALTKARARGRQMVDSVDAAWKLAVRDVVLGSAGGITAKQLNKVLPVGEEDADRLLSELAIRDELRSEVTRDGRLSFTPPLRIDDAYDTADRDLEAEIERLAEEEATAELGSRRSVS